MKLKQLEGLLGDLQQFSNPKVELEQYPTGPHIASRMLYTAETSFGDVSDRVVADFGCGCGTLGIAAALLGAEHVIGIDVDSQSLEIASTNAEELEVELNLVQCDLGSLDFRGQIVDTVVMNPPFGTRKKGSDMEFLRVALAVASQAVYSLHKTSTREGMGIILRCNKLLRNFHVVNDERSECLDLDSDYRDTSSGPHVKRAALQDFNAGSAEVLCELRYDVPHMYKFHKKRVVDIAVDLWRFVPQGG